ncbi:uncharacterized protein LOC126748573 isoform X2 [Anthonomus grandis grandis]|nr:uncharacterized protein LOC126748573 isoform X2 [Anthonomus grandis grandis]XP_050313860.1 uncharacterized protein LOC126748573 isoform X2 [Anthonomus grandis grandis]XP_050313861.1 uncharacterized protein LOC126748573 isoform X2 [Anthonomus grandis grandis]
MMLQLAILSLLSLSCIANPNPARIYNVLITSKKNLSPSHAQPVYEPILRTTSIGYAFPPFYYTSLVQNIPANYISPDYSGIQRVEATKNVQSQEEPSNGPGQQQQLQTDSNQPTKVSTQNSPPIAPSGQLVPQYDPTAPNYSQYISNGDEGTSDVQHQNPVLPPLQQSHEETDPKKVIANLRRNNGIPDVPPPPLPVRMKQ